MKGVILAGGSASRLYPLTRVLSKHLLPVYDKPMIYYPLSVLMLAGIREVLLISTPEFLPAFRQLLGDGRQWGIQLDYAEQQSPNGLPHALTAGEQYIDGHQVCVVLGDNIFYGDRLGQQLREERERLNGCTAFAYRVSNPQEFGVVEFGSDGEVMDVLEKPQRPPSRYAVTGLYMFNERVCEEARSLRPSARGETEICDLLRRYLQREALRVHRLGRGMAWLDAGTPESLHQASSFIQSIQERQGMQVACPEEIAFRQGWIDREVLSRQIRKLEGTDLGAYLDDLLHRGPFD